MDKLEIIETINKFFINVDHQNWKQVLAHFSPIVLLDYTSMTGGQPASLMPDQIISSWKNILPGFDKTHHQIGNHVVSLKGDSAVLFCYGTASHYLKNDSDNNTWVVVGTYDFILNREDAAWKISSMKFNLFFIDGNMELPALAQKRIAVSV